VAIETNDFNKPTDESRAVEKFIRLLIANNELSLARNILEALGEKYSYLLFELEVQAGNYKRAVEIYNYLPKDKQQNYLHIIQRIENDAENVAESIEKIIKEYEQENYAVFIAEVQKLKRTYPQVVEAIAFELLAAIRKNDKKRIKLLSELLYQIDKSHPLLSRVKSGKNLTPIIGSAFLIVLFVIVLANLLVSVFSLTKSGSLELSSLDNKITNISKSIESFSNKSNQEMRNISQTIEIIKTSIEYLDNKISQIQPQTSESNNVSLKSINEQFQFISEKINSLEKSINSIKIYSTNQTSNQKNQGTQTKEYVYDEQFILEVSKSLVGIKNEMTKIYEKIQNQTSSKDYSQDFQILRENIKNLSSKIDSMNQVVQNMQNTQEKADLSSKIDELKAAINEIRTNQPEVKNIQEQLNILIDRINKLQVNSSQNVQSASPSMNIEDKISSIESQLLKIIESLNNIKDSKTTESVKIEDVTQIKNSVASLGDTVSKIEKEISEIKEQMNRIEKSLSDSSNVSKPTNQSTQVQVQNNSVNIQDILKETKDLREIFLIGLRYYNNSQYEISNEIMAYLRDQLEGIDIYFKEDVFYYEIMSKLKLGDKSAASKIYQNYKKEYPSGQYIKELEQFF